jgi:hypothetical protein
MANSLKARKKAINNFFKTFLIDIRKFNVILKCTNQVSSFWRLSENLVYGNG